MDGQRTWSKENENHNVLGVMQRGTLTDSSIGGLRRRAAGLAHGARLALKHGY